MNLIKNLKNLFKKRETSEINTNVTINSTTDATDEQKLVKLKEDFNKKRFEYRSTRNIWYTVAVALTSIGIFIYMINFILGQSSSHDIVTTLRSSLVSKEFINTEFASAISISASFALIIPIMYTIARVMRTQQRNAEISNLNLEIRNIRSRIIQQKQERITPTGEDIKRNISTDIEIMLNLLKLTKPNYIAYPELQNIINAIRSRYSDYDARIKYKYASALGAAFSKVNLAILAFMDLPSPPSPPPTPPPTPMPFNYSKAQIETTISLLEDALLSLKTAKGGTNP
jgi:hypothetical protein